MSFTNQIIHNNSTPHFHAYKYNLMAYLVVGENIPHGIEIQLMMIRFFQMLSFTFCPLFTSAWRDTTGFRVLSNIIESFRLLSLFKGDQSVYLLFFYACVVYLILYCLLLFYIAVSLTNNVFIVFWPLRIVRFITRITMRVLFIPLLSKFIFIINPLFNRCFYINIQFQCG